MRRRRPPRIYTLEEFLALPKWYHDYIAEHLRRIIIEDEFIETTTTLTHPSHQEIKTIRSEEAFAASDDGALSEVERDRSEEGEP